MKTPAFWSDKNALSTALLPLSTLYRLATRLRYRLISPVALPIPVICIGNVTAGGAGKTPVALTIGKRLREKNCNAFFLSRGYGGTLRGPVLVDRKHHTAQQVGDEALLLADILPTVVCANRASGAQLAILHGAQTIIMDDGFQNPSLKKDLSFLVIDGETGMGNQRLLPAGPLREPVDTALERCQGVIFINAASPTVPLPSHIPVLHAMTVGAESALSLEGKPVVAFCGIGYPQKFFALLRRLGALCVREIPFPDHYIYTKNDLQQLLATASAHQAILVTTAKDAVRLSSEMRKKVTILNIELRFDHPSLLDDLLEQGITAHAPG